jgi:hypothetical protein
VVSYETIREWRLRFGQSLSPRPSNGAALREILPSVEHRQSRYLDNRCEVSRQPTRRRERHMRRFKSARQAQQFLATHTPIHTHFQPRRRHLSASDYRLARARLFGTWRDTNGSAFVAWRGVMWGGLMALSVEALFTYVNLKVSLGERSKAAAQRTGEGQNAHGKNAAGAIHKPIISAPVRALGRLSIERSSRPAVRRCVGQPRC